MKGPFAIYRNEKQEIDLVGMVYEKYKKDEVSISGVEYVEKIIDIQPIRSRQVAAMILVTAERAF